MYSIINNYLGIPTTGANSIVATICGVVAIVLFAEFTIMILKFFKYFIKF